MKPLGKVTDQEVAAVEDPPESPSQQPHGTMEKGTSADERDMYRMNKVLQLNPYYYSYWLIISRSNNFSETSASCPSSGTA